MGEIERDRLPTAEFYQARDEEVIDYALWRVDGLDVPLRGPRPHLATGRLLVCLGAAQTFGRFAPSPYPAVLAAQLATPVLNLGVGGAGPAFFVGQPKMLELANRASLAIVQVMSGRSESNSRFDAGGVEIVTDRADGRRLPADAAYRELLETADDAELDALVEETRHNWVASYEALFDALEVPTVLLWFSRRDVEYVPRRHSLGAFFGGFPQLVSRPWIEPLLPRVDAFVRCVSARGLPQPLFSKRTGGLARIQRPADLGGGMKVANDYYPSPEMHQDAASALLPVCRELLAEQR